MCALRVPVEQTQSLDVICVHQKDLASRILSNATNTRFTQEQIERCANVDWITIYQDHKDKQGQLRTVSQGIKLDLDDMSSKDDEQILQIINNFEDQVYEFDGKQFLQNFRSYKSYMFEGSHSTRLMIFCDGTRVFMSGNVGRYGRSDNVFNLNLDDTIAKANRILKELDLPPFTTGSSEVRRSQFDGKVIRTRVSGAVITRLDVNVNFRTGSESNAQYLIDYLQARSMSYVSKSVSGRSSVQWGKKGGRLYTKAYVKHEEMFSHCKAKDRDSLVESFAYKYVKENGIVRIETEIDRKTLYDTGFRDLEKINMSIIASIAKNKIDQLLEDIPMGLQHFEPQKVFHKKEHRKYIKTLSMWKSGLDLMDFNSPVRVMSKSTFYEHQKEILKISGLDISQRYIEGITEDSISLVSSIELEPVECPEEYDMQVDWVGMPELNVIDLTKHLPTRKQINEALLSVVPTQDFLQLDLSQPNHKLIEERRIEKKRVYNMNKLYEIHKQNKRAH